VLRLSVLAVLMSLVAMCAMPAQPALASGSSVETAFSFGADQETTSPDGCIRTSVFLGAGMHSLKVPPARVDSTATVSLEIEQFNTCTSESLLVSAGTATLSKGQLTGDINAGTLNATDTLYDSTHDTTFDVEVHVTYVRTSQVTISPESSHFGGGVNCHSFRKDAVALITGTVASQTTVYASSAWNNGSVSTLRDGCS
jgi:hypothetical protein